MYQQGEMRDDQVKMDEKLMELEQKVTASTSRIDLLHTELKELTDKFDMLHRNVSMLKIYSVQQNYVISNLVSRLLEGKSILRQTGEKWKNGEMHEAFFDFLNFTQPCKELCPVKYGIFHSCGMSSNLKKIHLEYSLPLVSKNLTIVEADAFTLSNLNSNKKLCALRYSGPRMAIISTEEDCVYAVHTERAPVGKLPLSPSLTCKKGLSFKADDEFFRETDCDQISVKDFIQVKVYDNKYYIYCAGSSYVMGKRNVTCPNKVFTLPLTATFEINDVVYKGSVLNIVYKQTEDPLFLEKVQWHLEPHVNWDTLGDKFDKEWKENEESIKKQEFYYHSDSSTLIWLLAITILCIAAITVAIILKNRRRICKKNETRTPAATQRAEQAAGIPSNHRVIINSE